MRKGTDDTAPVGPAVELERLRDAGLLTAAEFDIALRAIAEPVPTTVLDAPTVAVTAGAPDPQPERRRRSVAPVLVIVAVFAVLAGLIGYVGPRLGSSADARGEAATSTSSRPATPRTTPSAPTGWTPVATSAAPQPSGVPGPVPAAPDVQPPARQPQASGPVRQNPPAQAQPPPVAEPAPPARQSVAQNVSVSATGGWQDTGVTVSPGDNLDIRRTGSTWSPFPSYSYDGRGCIDTAVCSQDPEQANNICCMAHGGLIARIGTGAPFAVGNGTALVVTSSGPVQLRMNDRAQGDNSGQLDVRVTRP